MLAAWISKVDGNLVTLTSWLRWHSSYFSTVRSPPFSFCNLWKKVTMYSSHLTSEVLRVKHLHQLFGILLHGRCDYSRSLFMRSVTELYECGPIDTYFTLCVISVQLLLLGAFSCFLCLCNIFPWSFFFEHFFILRQYRMLQACLLCFLPQL